MKKAIRIFVLLLMVIFSSCSDDYTEVEINVNTVNQTTDVYDSKSDTDDDDPDTKSNEGETGG